MVSALSSATLGMQRAVSQFDAAATRLAQTGSGGSGSGDVDLATEAVNLVQAKTDVDMNVAMVQAAARMERGLLDILV